MKKSIILLSVANLLIGLIEFIFNIYLSRILGAEGLGTLSLISPINCLFLSFMTEGLVVTISKISAENLHFARYNLLHTSVMVSIGFSFLWSAFLCVVVLFSAEFIAGSLLGDENLKYAIMATCPLMLLMSVSNITKGHFLGMSKITVPAAINIAEKLLRFPILYALVGLVLNKYDFPPVTVVYLCYGLGEMQSVLLLQIYYKWTKRKLATRPASDSLIKKIGFKEIRVILRPLVLGAAPVCLTQCSLELFNAFSAIIVKSRLCSSGFAEAEALSLLGQYKGMVFPLVNYPLILVGSACSIVIPRISTLMASGKKNNAGHLMLKTAATALVVGIITCTVFFLLADDMGFFFYKRNDLGTLIRLAGLASPIVYVSVTTTNLLIGASCESESFRNTLFQQLLLLIGLVLFTGIPALNIKGFILAIALSNLVLLCQNSLVLWKKMKAGEMCSSEESHSAHIKR